VYVEIDLIVLSVENQNKTEVQITDWRVTFRHPDNQIALSTAAVPPECWSTGLAHNREGVSSALCCGVYVNSHVAEMRMFNGQ
jgi:hypothetical protein